MSIVHPSEKTMKKVSVVIPFYSHLDWLYEAVESVFSQTYSNYEIILVDDGSKEDLTDFLARYGDRITYLRQENKGPAAARNTAIRHATGDYIAFEDSDDIWLPAKLEKQVAFMEETGAMWSHTGFYYWWPGTGKMKEVDTSRDYDNIYLQRLISTQIATPSVMIDRRVYDLGDYYFPEDTRNGEDDRLYLELARKFRIALVQEPLLKVRMRGANSQSHAVERFQLRRANYLRWREAGEKLPVTVHAIYSFYRVYAGMFGTKSNGFKEFMAKCFWTVPYLLERLYVRYLYRISDKDERFIKRNR